MRWLNLYMSTTYNIICVAIQFGTSYSIASFFCEYFHLYERYLIYMYHVYSTRVGIVHAVVTWFGLLLCG